MRQAEELLFFGYLGYTDASVHNSVDRKRGRSLVFPPPTSLKCVLMYSRHQRCSSEQPISSAKRAMPMALAGSTCLVRKSQHALATSSTWYLEGDHSSVRRKSPPGPSAPLNLRGPV